MPLLAVTRSLTWQQINTKEAQWLAKFVQCFSARNTIGFRQKKCQRKWNNRSTWHLWSSAAGRRVQGEGEESAFVQTSGGGPDLKALWVTEQAVQEMWCNWDATMPLHRCTRQCVPTLCSFQLSAGCRAPLSSRVATAGYNISDCIRHPACQVESVSPIKDFTTHTRPNKSIHHIWPYLSHR